MKGLLKFLTIGTLMITLSSCGTDQIVVPEDDEKSGDVVYVSPADKTTTDDRNILNSGKG